MSDKCEFCRGTKGGVLGNENIIGGVIACDYCTALLMKIDDVKALESKSKLKPPEFRKGDLIRVWVYGYRRFVIVCGYSETTGWLQVECADGKIRSVNPTNAQAELIDRPSKLTGPIRVGSCVRICVPHGWLGIVSDVDGLEFTVCFADGTRGFYQELHLDHIAAPE